MTARQRIATAALLALAAGVLALIGPAAGAAAPPHPPVRAALYDAGYPEGWRRARGTPAAGRYSSASRPVIRSHLRALEHAGFAAAIVRWNGARGVAHARLPRLLAAARAGGTRVRVAVAYTPEARTDPTAARIARELRALARRATRRAAYLWVGGRPVVFVEGGREDGCRLVSRWRRADPIGVHLVVRAFRGHSSCRAQPDGWYDPLSAGRGARSPAAFRAGVRRLRAAGPAWQVVDSFNDWRRGTAIEHARAWTSPSGFGVYLDILADPWLIPRALAPGEDPVVAAAGDIACSPSDPHFNGGDGTRSACRQGATAELLAGGGYSAVLALGDLQYEHGEPDAFASSFAPSWGRVRELIRPALGNHEYGTPEAGGYFDYFLGRGAADGPAGPRGQGFYAFDVGTWRLIALNSNCGEIGGCGAGSPQHTWLRDELRARPRACTLAYWHHALFSSGGHGDDARMRPLFELLEAAGAEVVLAGHDHDYERFAPQSAAGAADPAGIRQFVVGTGGVNRRGFKRIAPNSEVRESRTFGVLELKLRASGYEWSFRPIAGATFSDTGAGACR